VFPEPSKQVYTDDTFILKVNSTYTSLFVVETPSNRDSIAIHLIGNRPPWEIKNKTERVRKRSESTANNAFRRSSLHHYSGSPKIKKLKRRCLCLCLMCLRAFPLSSCRKEFLRHLIWKTSSVTFISSLICSWQEKQRLICMPSLHVNLQKFQIPMAHWKHNV